ncbi:MAG: ABC transporter substrate-binding protein [Oscillospiraceae bacterium]|nr:ABC transporter substrate-binding protein [Oscillospiraceae bacterium]
MKTVQKKWIPLLALSVCAAFVLGVFTGCGAKNNPNNPPSTTDPAAEGGVTVRLFQPEAEKASLWEELAADYKTLTGVTISVVTPAEEDALTRLKDALKLEKDAPALFLFSNPREYKAWEEHAIDLTETQVFSHLLDPNLALVGGGKPIAVPLGVEAFGIVANKAVLEKYFALDGDKRESGLTEIGQVNDEKKLAQLVKDLHKNREELGIDAVFAAPTLKADESAVWTQHLLSLPLSYEFRRENTDITGGKLDEIKFTYGDQLKAFSDLVVSHASAESDALEARAHLDAVKEFAAGKTAMLLGTTELWGYLNTTADAKVTKEELVFLPAYMGFAEEGKNQGLGVEVLQYAAINAKSEEAEILAAGEFLSWLTSSEKGTDFLANKLNLLAPYDTVKADYLPNNPLSADAFAWLKNKDVTNLVSWVSLSPGEEFREDAVRSGMNAYAKGESTWEKLKEDVVSGWKEFRAKIDETF